VSALDRPSEVLLVASFAAAGEAATAARAFLHTGLDVDHVAFLARESRGATLRAVARSARLRLPGVGPVVACGALAAELGRGSRDGDGQEQLATALRRLGMSATDFPRLVRAVREDRILVLAAVPREEALGWGRMLQRAGAASLIARPRLGRWPPAPQPVASPPSARGLTRARGRRERHSGTRWDGTAS
jgi:hypothetical protein